MESIIFFLTKIVRLFRHQSTLLQRMGMLYVSVNVWCHTEGQRVQLSVLTWHIHVYPLACRDGVRLLFCLFHPPDPGGPPAGGPVVPKELEWSRVQPHPGGRFSVYSLHLLLPRTTENLQFTWWLWIFLKVIIICNSWKKKIRRGRGPWKNSSVDWPK